MRPDDVSTARANETRHILQSGDVETAMAAAIGDMNRRNTFQAANL